MDRIYQTDFINKAQKVASAIYLITSFFGDQEPLKWRLRNLSIDLVSNTVKDKLSVIREILSLFLVAKMNNLLSESNYAILGKELSSLEDLDGIKSPIDLLNASEPEYSLAIKQPVP